MLSGLLATLEGPATVSPGQTVELALVVRNAGAEPRALLANQIEIAPGGKTTRRREVILSFSAGPREGPGLLPDRFQLSFGVPAGEDNLYLPPGESVRLKLAFPASRIPQDFPAVSVQALYRPRAGVEEGPPHLLSNAITLTVTRTLAPQGPRGGGLGGRRDAELPRTRAGAIPPSRRTEQAPDLASGRSRE